MYRLLLLSLLALTACRAETGTSGLPTASSPECPALEQIFSLSDSLSLRLQAHGSEWPALADSLLHRLSANASEPEACRYLNHSYAPARPRFEFVTEVSGKCIGDTVHEAIGFLVRLRGIFGNDADITEYLSEEIAHIALNNPVVYLDYLHTYPGQKEMLLNSTRWDPHSAERLQARFAEADTARQVTPFLENWAARLNSGMEATP